MNVHFFHIPFDSALVNVAHIFSSALFEVVGVENADLTRTSLVCLSAHARAIHDHPSWAIKDG